MQQVARAEESRPAAMSDMTTKNGPSLWEGPICLGSLYRSLLSVDADSDLEMTAEMYFPKSKRLPDGRCGRNEVKRVGMAGRKGRRRVTRRGDFSWF